MAEDRSLDEVFRYELEKRSTHEGIVLAALNGDRNAIRDFADLAVAAIESRGSDKLQNVREWLAYVLSRIAAGTEPNEAFGFKHRSSGRPPSSSQDFATLMERWIVGQHMAGLVKTGKSQRAAASEVSAQRCVSVEKALACFSAFTGETKGGKTAAKRRSDAPEGDA